MSNTTEVAEATTVAINQITVEEGFNPRGTITKASVSELAKSIKQEGLLQPVLVRPTGDGYTLVAGHRRMEAAKIAGLTEIPVLIRGDVDEEKAKELAFDENEQREDMTPMARGIALNHQFKKLGSFKKVASTRALNAQQVGALVKMCDLPDSIQKIALGNKGFGPDLAKTLVEVANTPGGEPVAVMLATQAMESVETERLIRTSVNDALDHLIKWRREQETAEAKASVPFAECDHGLTLSDVFEDAEKVEDLQARAIAAKEVLRWSDNTIRTYGGYADQPVQVDLSLPEASIDRLRASGVLFTVEIKRGEDWINKHNYVFDPEALRTEIEQTIEAAEKAAKKELKRQEAEAKKAGSQKSSPDPATIGENGEVKTDHQIKKEAAAKARIENEAIGQALLARDSKKVTKKQTLELTRLTALVFVRQSDNLAALGMRLCFPSWKTVEEKELKSGEKREKVHYLEPREAKARLITAIEEAKTVEEIHLILSDAIVAATFSNEEELPQSKRVDAYGYYSERISKVERSDREFIDQLAKGVLPESAEAKRLESIEKGYEDRFASTYVPDEDDDADLEEEGEAADE